MRALLIGGALLLASCTSSGPGETVGTANAAGVVRMDGYLGVLADPARPAADRQRDAARKPAEVLAFAGVRPGMTVLEAMPGGGYFSRLFARAVGPTGEVLLYVPQEIGAKFNSEVNARALAAAYPNVKFEPGASITEQAPEPFADLVFTAQNWHDFYTPLFGTLDTAAANRALWSVVKPGGAVVIIDHAAQAGSGTRDANTLHRIDEDVVKREMAAAGFVLEAESQALRNPADPRTANVFDPAIRGRTDQFMLRFRKPAR